MHLIDFTGLDIDLKIHNPNWMTADDSQLDNAIKFIEGKIKKKINTNNKYEELLDIRDDLIQKLEKELITLKIEKKDKK